MKAWKFLDEREWTQFTLARDALGEKVDEHALEAFSFCAVGAVCRTHGNCDIYTWGTKGIIAKIETFLNDTIKRGKIEHYPEIFGEIKLRELKREMPISLSAFNDLRNVTKENIVALLKHLDI